MRCEVCGRRIIGESNEAIIEGVKMLVCRGCVKLGSAPLETKNEPILRKIISRLPTPTLPIRKQPIIMTGENLELADDYGLKIRQAREKLCWSHKDLGRKINERISVLRKIESGKMTPDNSLVEKLQHILRIKLLTPISEPKVPKKALASPQMTIRTLGDVAQVRKEGEK